MSFTAHPRPVLEELEPRILYAADLAAVGWAAADAAMLAPNLQHEPDAAARSLQEIAFVDLSVPDAEILITGLLAERDAGRPIEVVRIDAGADGIAVIGQTLAQRQGVTAVHLLAHGSDGVVRLGAAQLDGATLLARAGELAQWSTALGTDADLLIYGCDVAAGPAGEALVAGLAALTGADVAASTDLTGAAAQGGNWRLEFTSGPIDAATAPGAGLQQAYAGVLAITDTGTSSAATAGALATLSFTHTVGAGADGLLVVQVMTGDDVAVTSVTFNGVALSPLASATSSGSEVRAEFWILKAPPVGSASVQVTTAASTKFVAGATSFAGVDQAMPTGPVFYDKSNDGAPTLTLVASAGERVLDLAGALRVGSYTVGAGQTQAWSHANGSGNGDVWAVSSTEPGAASVTMSHNFTSVGGASDKWISLATTIRPANVGTPVITSDGGGATASRSVAENSTTVTTVVATDADGTVPAYRIVGGADGARFVLNASSGALAFASAPDFEAPADAGADNVYQVIVAAEDGTYSDVQTLEVTVTNVNEAPLIVSNGGGLAAAISLAENTAAVTTVVATDVDSAALGYSIRPSPDASKFLIDPVTGALTFKPADLPDFENPQDAGNDRVYDLTVRASDGTLFVDQAIAVSITDVGGPLTVTTPSDMLDGNTGSIELLLANPGADGLISLREAISAANNTPGPDTILLPAGTYSITRAGAGEDLNATGDFDLTSSVTLQGSGATTTVIDANGLDRVFSVFAGTVSFLDLTVRGGNGGAQGGGIASDVGSSIVLDHVIVSGNVANNGAGIYSQGDATLVDVRLTGNGDAATGSGGGLNNRGDATLTRVTVDNNTGTRGAGIYSTGPTLTVDNSTISGNVAIGIATGGGLYTNKSGYVITNSTIANNSALFGGGIYTTTSNAISLGNTILADNAGGNNYAPVGAQQSLGYNLDTDGSTGLNAGTDQNVVAAGLSALAAHGGFAPTHALQAGSAAIDQGNPLAPAFDQRGVGRSGAAPDVGAYEAASAADRAPVQTVPGAQTLLEDALGAIAGLSVTDPDQGGGTALYELSKTALSVSAGTLQVVLAGSAAISAGANASASLTLAGSQADINTTLATLRYQGNADYGGADTLVMVSQDGAGLSDSDNVAITVGAVNDPPHGTDATLVVAKDTSRVLARADFGFADAAGEGHAFVSVVVQAPSAGTLALLGTPIAGATEVTVAQLDAGDLVFTPAPGASANAYATLAFQVRDGGGNANGGADLDPVPRTLSFDVTNSAPVNAVPVADQTARAGLAFTLTLPAGSFTDADAGDTLTYGAALGGGGALPAWLAFDPAMRTFSGTPAAADAGTLSIRISATDDAGAVAFDEFSLVVAAANTAPVIGMPVSATLVQDGSLAFSTAGGNAITVSDAEAGSLPLRLDLSATHGVLALAQAIGSEFQVNASTASHQQSPRIAVAADGHYVVVWQSNNQDGSKFGIFARIFDASGSALSGEIAVNTTTDDQQTDPAVAIDASGRFVVAWQSYDTARLTHDIYARSFDADGTALSGQKRITSDADEQTQAAVSMDATGQVLIAYQSKGQDNAGSWGIYARTADATLSTIDAEFRVNTTTALDQTAPRVAAGDGGYTLVWQSIGQDGSGSGIYGQRSSLAGTLVGAEFLINVTTALDQSAPDVAMSADGRFAVTWQSAGQDGSGAGVYARRYDAAGSAQGGEWRVNTTTLGDQTAPSVAMATDGHFNIAWTSRGQDHGDGKEGVYAQGYAADGTPLAGEVRLNTTTADVQAMAAIGVRSDGGVLAVWQSNDQDGSGYGVYGQRRVAPGAITFLAGLGIADRSMSISGAQADLDIALQTLRFTPDAGYWGPADLTLLSDDLGAGSGPPLATTRVLPIQVLKLDVGPVNTVPAAQATTEDMAIVFAAAKGTLLSVADEDADPLPVQVSLSVVQGTLRLASTAGLAIVGGADGTAAIVVQGRLADLNAGLDGLSYTPWPDVNGADTLTLVTDDLGHSEVGGPYRASSTVAITVAAVNDAPSVRLPAAATTIEGNVLVFSSANGNAPSIADPDAGSGTIEVTLVVTHGALQLARTNNLSFIVGDGRGGEQRIAFRGTLDDVNLALDGLEFSPLAGHAGPAWLELATNDLGNSGAGGPLTDRAVLEISVQPDANNARPVIMLPAAQTTVEETPRVLSVAAGNGITVLDDAGGQPLQVTLTLDSGTLTLGTTTGAEFQVATAVAGDQQAAAVATTPTGAHVVVWQSNNQDGSSQGIFLQRYSAEGYALGLEQRVNTTTAGAQTAPALALADDGSFVVVWTSDGQDGGGAGGTGIHGQRFDAAGVALGGEFRVHTTLANDQAAPAVALDAAGNFVVVWQSKDQDGDGWGVYGRRFDAAGAALGGEFRIPAVSAKDQSTPVVAMAASGSFVVAWQGVRPGGSDWGIYAQRFDAAGMAQGGEIGVNSVTYKDQVAPSIASDDGGNFVIAWQSQDIDYNDGKFGIYAQRYGADGTLLGAQFLVNTTRPDDQSAPAVTMDGSGSFVVAWQTRKQDNADDKSGIYAQRFAAGGAPIGGEFLVNSSTADAQTAPALALSDNGRLTVLWTSNAQDGSGLGVFGQRFFDARSLVFSVGDGSDDARMIFTGTLEQINDVLDGLVFTPAPDFDGAATLDISVDDLGHSGIGGAKVATQSLRITVSPVNDAPVIAVPAAQTFIEDAPIEISTAAGRAITISDVDAGNQKLRVTLSAPAGTLTLGALTGLQFTAGDGTADTTMVFDGTLAQLNDALDGLRLALPAHYTGVAAVELTVDDQGHSGAGTALGTSATLPITVLPGPVNDVPQVAVPGSQRTAVDTPLVLAADTTGAFTVVDDAGGTPVRVTVMVVNGTATLSSTAGAEATINAAVTAGRQDEPRMAVLPSGDHIVVWTADDAAGGTEVRGQRFDAAGARIGPEFVVNTTVTGKQWAPALAVNDSAAFAVAWVSDNQDGSGRGIYLQRFDAQGRPQGSETRVNTSIAGDQVAPTLTIDAGGAVVVAWQSADGDGQGIFAQRFDAQGAAAGAEFRLNVDSVGEQRTPALAVDAAGNFVAVWAGRDADKEGVLARRFDAAGNARGAEFVVNSVTVGSQIAPSVAMNGGGAWVVGWQSGNGGEVLGQRFDAAGVAVGAAFQANTTNVDAQTAPAVAINGGGDFVFVWQSRDASGQGIFGQAYAADGAPIGREQQVNTRTPGNQAAPSAGIAADGSYRVVWTGDNQDGSGSGIGGQRMLRGDEWVFHAGDGVDDANFSFDASLADLNAALDGLRFTPTSAFVGVAQVRVSVDDLGASGAGGAQVGSGTLTIVVGNAPLVDLDADDSGGVAGADFRADFRTGLGPVPVADADATLADPNNANLQRLTVRIQNPLDGAAERLAADTTATPIVANYDSGSATLTLSGSTTLANYQKVLRTITYDNAAGAPTPMSRSLSFVAFDGTSNSNAATTTVYLNGAVDSPPTAGDDLYSTLEDRALTVLPGGVFANDADPDADPLSALLASGPSSGVLTSFNADGSFTYLPAAGFSGVDSFSYRTSARGLFSGIATVTIFVNAVNDAPSGADATRVIAEDTGHTFARADFGFADGGDVPPDGLLGVRIAVLPANGVLRVGGAAVITGDVVAAGDIDAGRLVYTPAPNANGSGVGRIGFQVRDDGSTSSGGIDTDPVVRWLTIDVSPVADAPAVGVPIADRVADEDSLFVLALPAGSLVDADAGEPLRYRATLADASRLPAWLSFDAGTQTFVGTPGNGDVGAVTVRVSATDAAGLSAYDDFVLTVDNVNDVPTLIEPLADQVATQGVPTAFGVPGGTFADIDAGDTLTYMVKRADGGALPGWLRFDGATRSFGGTPGNTDVGVITVRVTATDAAGASVFDDFSLAVSGLDSAPMLVMPIADQSATEGLAFAFKFGAGTFDDADVGDSLVYSATRADGSALPAWLGFDGPTRSFGGTPGPADLGTISVRVTATDREGVHAHDDFDLAVAAAVNANEAPSVAWPLVNQEAIEDAAFAYTFDAATFVDADAGEVLAYSATRAGGGALPGWLAFDATTRSFSGTPGNADLGRTTITVTATDGAGAAASTSFDLSVANANDAPTVAAPIAGQSATEDVGFSFVVAPGTFADIDAGDALRYSASGLPAWLGFDAATRSFSGTPGNADLGRTTITVTATDGAGADASTSFDLSVADANDAPTVAAPIASQSATEDVGFSFVVAPGTFADIDADDALRYSASGLPAWLGFDAATRSFSGTPGNADLGRTTITVTATDGAGADASTSFELTVDNVNDAPRFTSHGGAASASVGAFENSSAAAVVHAVDDDLDTTLRYAIDGGADAAALRIDPATGELEFVAPPDRERPADANGDGRYEVSIRVTDGQLFAYQALSIELLDVDEPPTLRAHTLVISEAGVAFDLESTDPDTARSALVYRVEAVVGGRFEWADGTAGPLSTFTQDDVDADRVSFVRDGSGAEPAYLLQLADAASRLEVGLPQVHYVVAAPAMAMVLPAAADAAPDPAPDVVAVVATPPAAKADDGAPRPDAVATVNSRDLVAPADTTAPALATAADIAPAYEPLAAAAGAPPLSTTPMPSSGRPGTEPPTAGVSGALRADQASDDAGTAGRSVSLDFDPVRSAANRAFAEQLDRVREEVADLDADDEMVVGSASALATGLSAGYVLWLVRGGVLLASLMSSVPAWAGIDPLPVLAQMRRGDDEDGDGEGDGDFDGDGKSVDPVEELFGRARRLLTRPVWPTRTEPAPAAAPTNPTTVLASHGTPETPA